MAGGTVDSSADGGAAPDADRARDPGRRVGGRSRCPAARPHRPRSGRATLSRRRAHAGRGSRRLAARGFGGRNAARSSGVWSGEVSPGGDGHRTPSRCRTGREGRSAASGLRLSVAGGGPAMKAASGSRALSELRPKERRSMPARRSGSNRRRRPRARGRRMRRRGRRRRRRRERIEVVWKPAGCGRGQREAGGARAGSPSNSANGLPAEIGPPRSANGEDGGKAGARGDGIIAAGAAIARKDRPAAEADRSSWGHRRRRLRPRAGSRRSAPDRQASTAPTRLGSATGHER